jgi:hypothetical protein
MSGSARAFFIALGLCIGIPLLMLVLAAVFPPFAMFFAFTIVPALTYALPAMVFPGFAEAHPFVTTLSIVAPFMIFAAFLRNRDAKTQLIAAALCISGWWLFWRVLAAMLGVQAPPMNVHM